MTRVTSAPRASGLGGDGVALLARGAVGDDPHGVDGLPSAAGGDQDSHAGKVTGPEHPLGGGDDVGRIGQASGAHVATGESSDGGVDDVRPPGSRNVARLSCTAGCSHISVCIAGHTITVARVASSVAVTRSSEMPAAVLADHPSRGRGDDDQVSPLTEVGVGNRLGLVPQRGAHGFAGQRRERDLADEAGRVFGHDG